ncbi:MRP-type abc transporter [Naegleria gruberi]|uniref:MRP-type abc transporter n=1 Tax=Naegleria gruberi TaxID=5762 RepID=D2V124_NAEGR|nr:MRP-type abc transporter [Naegleria gruberi]EFC49615.1 MRP-type abc transporter [Naegleria gruberi]|eukprot:XP_002682359.1 MRP-type abc transporter [Naegleria gruberi strain NEG-M]
MNQPTDEKSIFTILVLLDGISVPIFELPKCLNQVIYAKHCLDRLNNLFSNLCNRFDSEKISPAESLAQNKLIEVHTGTKLKTQGKTQIVSLITEFIINSGEWTALRGKSGSGKTSFIFSVLDSYQQHGDGIIRMANDLKIIYTPQDPFIVNGTILENITFGLPLDEEIYNRVLKESQLVFDLDQWCTVLGDEEANQKVCGYFGNNISGGQKVRVNLARGLYKFYYSKKTEPQDCKYLLIFDEIFNPLDPTVTTVIMESFRRKLKNLSDTSVLFSISDSRYDSYLDRVYDIVEGNISEGILNAHHEDLTEREFSSPKKEKRFVRVSSNLSELSTQSQSEDGIQERMFSPFEIAKFYLTSKSSIYTLGPTLFFLIVSQIFKSSTNSLFGFFNDYLYLFVLLGCLRVVVELCLGYFWGIKCYKTSSMIHNHALNKVMHVPLSYFVNSSSNHSEKKDRYGDVIERFSTNMNTLDRSIPWLLKEASQKWLECLGSLITLLLYIAGASFWVVLFSLIITIVIIVESRRYYHLYSKTKDELSLILSDKRALMSQLFMESTHPTALIMIQSYNQVDYFNRKFRQSVSSTLNVSYAFNTCTDWIGVRLECLISLLLFIPFMYLVQAVCEDSCQDANKQNLHYAGILLTTCIEFFNRFLWTLVVSTRVESELPFIGKIISYIHLKTEDEEQHSEKVMPSSATCQSLELESVSCKNILNSVSFRINPCEMTGIIGRTGSGKSFALSCIHRYWYPIEGSIYLDGRDIFNYDTDTYRNCVSMIPQDTSFMIGSTLREHFDENNYFTDNEILEEIEKFQIVTSSINLNKIINKEEDLKIEKPIIYVIRAILLVSKLSLEHSKRPKILLLDEITSNLDNQNTQNIVDSVKRMNREYGLTVVWVTHQLSCLKACDNLLCFDSGRVIEEGKVEQLLNNPISNSYSLFRMNNYNTNNTN